jgi:nitrile hydratase
MNGVHDLGGLHGFGPVRAEAGEPVFHAAWEARAFGVVLAMGATGAWNLDQSRHARESLPAATYLGSSYYRIWTLALERLMLARGLVTAQELARGQPLVAARPGLRVLRAEAVDAALALGAPTQRSGAAAPAAFAIGQRVRAKNVHPAGHTRLPRYVRGHVGTLRLDHGVHVHADAHAASPPGAPFDESPCRLYAVAFSGEELWGDSAEPGTEVIVDIWEPMLEAVAEPPCTAS